MGWAFRVVMWTCDRESSRQSGKQSWNSRCISDGMLEKVTVAAERKLVTPNRRVVNWGRFCRDTDVHEKNA